MPDWTLEPWISREVPWSRTSVALKRTFLKKDCLITQNINLNIELMAFPNNCGTRRQRLLQMRRMKFQLGNPKQKLIQLQ